MTKAQFRARQKSVTRRLGWWSLKPGDVVCGVEKAQGLKKGETVKRIWLIRIVSARGEELREILKQGQDECAREGFPDLTPSEFMEMFKKHHAIPESRPVNRIEYEYL